jgi:hypothetical protein
VAKAGQNVSFLKPICWERKDRTARISRFELLIGGGEGEAARDIASTGSGAAGGIITPGLYCCVSSSNIL